ncbi:MAG TPA: hypothetical protein VJ779_22690 [Acetobacteraceae bacterium]|nr:hypothetical protein [Acetobacteraceae bacterium]
MPSRRAALPMLAAALLAGCAGPQPARTSSDLAAATPPSTAPAEAGAAPSGIDGLYRGSSTRYRADRRDCPHPGLIALLVQGGQFTYRWNGLTDVPGSIGPDGSISGQAGTVALSGRLDGEELQGDLTNGACALHFTAYRRFSAT